MSRKYLTDEQLILVIDGCIENDRRAQEMLFGAYYESMLATSIDYLKDYDTAQEAVQEGFIKVFNNIHTFTNEKTKIEGWIRMIIINTCRDMLRVKKRNKTMLYGDGFIFKSVCDETYDAEQDILDGVIYQYVIKAMDQLSPAYRKIFQLYMIEEYSHKEIAEQLEIHEGTSKSNLFKAKAKLKKILTQQFKFAY
jgi:RNA polymerase sigma-70 factor (ECF subfamily)